jgi:hypothetical protein
MNASTDYCDFCDLPLSQCVHGRPAPQPAAPAPAAPRPRTRRPAAATSPAKPVVRRWTPPEALKPLVVDVLEEAGGSLPAEDALARLEQLLDGRMAAGDHELTPTGEPRWQYAARRARADLVQDGTLRKDEPGVWRLA